MKKLVSVVMKVVQSVISRAVILLQFYVITLYHPDFGLKDSNV